MQQGDPEPGPVPDTGFDGGSSVVSLDVGGTTIKAAVVDRSGRMSVDEVVPTDATDGPDAVVDRICDLAAGLAARSPGATAVSVVVPGLVDERAGVARYSANLGWTDVPLRARVASRIPAEVPVVIGHDVRTGAVAESVAGAGRGVGDFLFVPIGTGIAGAVVLDGVPYGGPHRTAGELGHVRVRPDGEPCTCGARGCLERYASAAAIVRRFERQSGRAVSSAGEVIDAAEQGDELAARVWADALDALTTVLAGYVNTMDPERIVIGGGLAAAESRLLVPLTRHLAHALTLVEAPEIVVAATGTDAGRIGAAILAFEASGIARSDLGWAFPGHGGAA